MNKSIPELSIDSDLLYKKLKTINKGSNITYQELSEIIDKDVQKNGRSYLTTARNMALRKDKLVFETIHGQGIKCLTDEENAKSTGGHAIKKIRKISKKATKKLIAIDDFEILSNESKIKHNTMISMFGAMIQATNYKKIKEIESVVENNQEKLSLNKTIELFK